MPALKRQEGWRPAECRSSRLIGVYGQVQREGMVVHLIARRLIDVSHLLGRLVSHSRNFH